MAGLGLSYAAASGWVGAVKSSLCRWLRRTPLRLPQLAGRALEMDGLWTRTRAGPVEMKVVRDENGVALGSFASWGAVIDLAWQQGATTPIHLVSDGDWAIAEGIAMVYGSQAPHQLYHFSASGGLREYRRNPVSSTGQALGWEGWREARQLLGSENSAAAMGWARRIMALTEGRARTGVRKPCGKDCDTWQRESGGTRPHRDWNGRTESTDDGKGWARYGRPTTCWRCSKIAASSTKPPKTERYQLTR